MEHKKETMYGTTVLCVHKDNKVVLMSDGQVTLGTTVMKPNARKIKQLAGGKILVGFAGSTADAFTLVERLEEKLNKHGNILIKACVELAKDWRTEKYLRRLEAMLIVTDVEKMFILTGNGDVMEPNDGVAAIGSGGTFALSAAKALIDIPNLTAMEIAKKAMTIAGDICIYSNHNFTIETLG